MVRIEVHGQRLARIRRDGESLGDWQIRGEGILGRRCLGGTVSTPKGHRHSVRTGDVNRDQIIGRIRELEASAQARVITTTVITLYAYLYLASGCVGPWHHGVVACCMWRWVGSST